MTPPTDRSASALRAVVTALGITIGAVPATLHAQTAKPAAAPDTASAAVTQTSRPTSSTTSIAPTATQIKLAPTPGATQIKLAPAPSAPTKKPAAAAGQTRAAEDEEPTVQKRPAGASAAPPTR